MFEDNSREVHIAIIFYGCSRGLDDKLPLNHYTCTMFELSEIMFHFHAGKKISDKLELLLDELPFCKDDCNELTNALFYLNKNKDYAFGCTIDGHPVAFAFSKSTATTAVKLHYADLTVGQ